jgi:hypothetical protein
VSNPDEPKDMVVLTRFSELAVARVLCGRLAAEGIEASLPDELRASQILHWHGPVGGFRIQVHQADLEHAKEILELPTPEPTTRAENSLEPDGHAAVLAGLDGEIDDGTISAGDRRAFRALRVTLLTLLLLGLVHPYSLVLAVQALRRSDVTAWGRWRAWVALVVSLFGCTCLGLLVYWLARLH